MSGLAPPHRRCPEQYILGKSNEVLMVCVDVGLLNVDEKKNLGECRGHCEYRWSPTYNGFIYDFSTL